MFLEHFHKISFCPSEVGKTHSDFIFFHYNEKQRLNNLPKIIHLRLLPSIPYFLKNSARFMYHI